jgi:hypothetical protein
VNKKRKCTTGKKAKKAKIQNPESGADSGRDEGKEVVGAEVLERLAEDVRREFRRMDERMSRMEMLIKQVRELLQTYMVRVLQESDSEEGSLDEAALAAETADLAG